MSTHVGQEVPGVVEPEQRVDELVTNAEVAWAGYVGPVTLEFLLPRSLVNLPVQHWMLERDLSGVGRPLALDYPISVRSLERMYARQWHRRWRSRWSAMQADPSPDRIYFVEQADLEEPHRLDAIMSDEQWVAAVLTGPPARAVGSRQGPDELMPTLRAGIPAVFWHPDASRDTMRDLVGSLVEHEGLVDLPTRTRAMRLKAYQVDAAFNDLTRDLVLLWDDPARIVTRDSPEALVSV